MNIAKYKYLMTLGGALFLGSCTDLKEEIVQGKYINENLTVSSSTLQGVYDQLNSIVTQEKTYAMEEHSTDEMMGPTRGTDWDDFGQWRKLHQHTWDAAHPQLINSWNDLNTGSYRATQVLAGNGLTNQIKGEASFLRATFMFYLVDLFGQVPQREATDSPDSNPKVYSRKDATDFVIKDLQTAIASLGSSTTPGTASKEAAEALLAKVYLNRAVYSADVNSPSGPFTFAKADMDAVIANCDAIIASGKYSLQAKGKYYQNFYWDNSTDSKELIFVKANDRTAQPANVRFTTYMGNHYNQSPSGWNGFTTLSDFYNSFEATDERRGSAITGFTDKTGQRFGFQVGQQYKGDGTTKILDRSGNPLIFTPNVSLAASTESQGIRVVKYPLDPAAIDNSPNDWVFLRYADVLLMKAEAIMRGGTATSGATALSLVNQVRVARGLTALTALDEKAMLAERGHELYYEGWRRNDQIRFGTFLAPVDQRPTASAATKVVYPIPQQAIDSNPNLSQNKGY